jgi:hypothetical protein
MGEAMDPMSPSNMNTDDRHVCIAASFNYNDALLFPINRNIRLGNELLTGLGQDELDECLGQGDAAPSWTRKGRGAGVDSGRL